MHKRAAQTRQQKEEAVAEEKQDEAEEEEGVEEEAEQEEEEAEAEEEEAQEEEKEAEEEEEEGKEEEDEGHEVAEDGEKGEEEEDEEGEEQAEEEAEETATARQVRITRARNKTYIQEKDYSWATCTHWPSSALVNLQCHVAKESPRRQCPPFALLVLFLHCTVSCESIKTSPGFGCLYSCLNLSFSQQLMNLALASNFLGCCTMSLQGPIAHLIPCARAAAHWSAALPALQH